MGWGGIQEIRDGTGEHEPIGAEEKSAPSSACWQRWGLSAALTVADVDGGFVVRERERDGVKDKVDTLEGGRLAGGCGGGGR